jgi:hypothetical protein
MDSECPAASRIAGKEIVDSGTLFTITAMWRTLKFGKQFLPNFGAFRVSGRSGHGHGSSGLRPYRRLADGDGR